MLNIQVAEKQRLRQGGSLEVHSIFYTIQGEGPFTGRPAVFVRLAGCNLQCPGCDTEYTKTRELLDPYAIYQAILEACEDTNFDPIVVITGGEPFRQNIGPLCIALLGKGLTVQVETNGTLFVSGVPYSEITVICSPKAGKVSPKLQKHITAYKYVMSHRSVDPKDGLPILALDHTAAPRVARPPSGFRGQIYLQPMDEGNGDTNLMNRLACVDSCLKHGYTMQLQIHKLLGLE